MSTDEPAAVLAPPSSAELSEVRAQARGGSWLAALRLAAAALADDDEHLAAYLAGRAVEAAGEDRAALGAATGLLAERGLWAEVIELAGPRWRGGVHGPAAGLRLLEAYVRMRRVDAAEDALHALYVLAAGLPADRAGSLRAALREREFMLDGLRVARHSPVAPTVQTRDFRDLVVPVPMWREPALDLPLADGPRIAVVPLAFSAERPQHRPLARGLMLWLAAALRTSTDADVSMHLVAHLRGPLTDVHTPHNRDLLLDLTGTAGQPAYLVGGAIHNVRASLPTDDYPTLDIDVWRPDGSHVGFYQHLGTRLGHNARNLLDRVAAICGAGPWPTVPLPSSRLLNELIPALADLAPLVLTAQGALPADLLDRRRERIDQLADLARAYPAEPEPRLLALGVLARLARAGWPLTAEYRDQIGWLADHPHPMPAALAAAIR